SPLNLRPACRSWVCRYTMARTRTDACTIVLRGFLFGGGVIVPPFREITRMWSPMATESISSRRHAVSSWNHNRPRVETVVLWMTGAGEMATRKHLSKFVWRFRSPHHSSRESAMRTSEPKPHEINKLLVSFDSEVRK